MHRGLNILLALALVVSMGLATTQPVSALGATREVGDGKDYATIGAALAAAGHYDTILVFEGTYTENLIINVPNITLKSAEGRDVTIIDAGGGNFAIRVNANLGDVTVEGFTVQNWMWAGIEQSIGQSEGTAFHVLNNLVKFPDDGPTQHGNGIQVSGQGSTVVGNIVEVNSYIMEAPATTTSGILVVGSEHGADNALVSGNELYRVPGGFEGNTATGIAVSGLWNPMTGATVTGNKVEGLSRGIYVQGDATDTEIVANEVKDNEIGILVRERAGKAPTGTVVHSNNIYGNTDMGLSSDAYPEPGDPVVVDARYNWWGDYKGPDHDDNPFDTTGNRVSDDVDFIPWLTDEYPPAVFCEVDAPVWHTDDQKTAEGTTAAGSVDAPANLEDGDLVILIIATQNSRNTPDAGITGLDPYGFELIRSEHDGTSQHQPEVVAFYKIADDEPDDYEFTVADVLAPHWKAIAGRVTGHNAETPIGKDSGIYSPGDGVESLEIPGITTSADNVLLIASVVARGFTPNTPEDFEAPYEMEEIWAIDGDGYAASGEPGTAGAEEVFPARGDTGTRTFTWLGGSRAAGLMFEILPPPAMPSTYHFVFEAPEVCTVWTCKETELSVTFEPEVRRGCGHDGVRFEIEADGPGTVEFTPPGEEPFEDEGFWGPEEGFYLQADYSETTEWMLHFSEGGEYTITFSLIWADDGEIICGTMGEVEITVKESATIEPDAVVYELIKKGDVETTITPNEQIEIISVKDALGLALEQGVHYDLDDENDVWTLTIRETYLLSKLTASGMTEVLTINFEEGAPIEFPITSAARSTYEFLFEEPAECAVWACEDIEVPVTFQTKILGEAGYDGVRFKFETVGPEGSVVTFKATDSNEVAHTFYNDGFWGPSAGFKLPADYEATTDWTLHFSEWGEYTITFSLIEAPDGDILCGTTADVTILVKELSTYQLEITPDYEECTVQACTPIQMDVTLSFDYLGNRGYDNVRFKAEADGPGEVEFTPPTEEAFDDVGFWPDDGFSLAPDYDDTDTWTIHFEEKGVYTITFSLVDSDGAVIEDLTDSVYVNVAGLYEFYNEDVGAIPDAFSGGHHSRYVAQTFTPDESHEVTKVYLLLSRSTGDPENPTVVTVSIKELDEDGYPTGDDLASGTILRKDLSELIARWEKVTFGPGTILDAGTKYAIVLTTDDWTARWHYHADGDYDDGNYLEKDVGEDWIAYEDRDFLFEVWGKVVTYTLTVDSSDGGEVTVPGEGDFDLAGTVELKAVASADECWQFKEWIGDTDTIANVYEAETTILMTDDFSITAVFEKTPYNLTIGVQGEGTVHPDVGPHTYACGDVVEIEATPAEGWTFVRWLGDTDEIANVYAAETTITMVDDNYSITAKFTELPVYTLTITSTDGGSVTVPGEADFPYAEGTVVPLLAEAETGYVLVNWTGDVGNIADVEAADTTITMWGDYSITAVFTFVGTHYHWGIGFPYGATEDVFAVAIVGHDGMDVYWYHDGWASPWLAVGWYHDVYSIDPESGLPHSGNPATWNEPVKGLFADYFPGEDVVYYGRTPIEVGDVPEPVPASTRLYYGTHYHWGIGFPYGATEDVFAVAIVGEDGMDVYWYHDGWASPWLAVGWYHDVYSIDPESGLPRSGDPDGWNEPVKGLFEDHFPGEDVVYYGRTPIEVGDVPEPTPVSELLEP